eukprot:snap_masked-scaffold_11-processed-gene-1.20-mRNA-1 protein AED:1.00 eAED:1.00 QI:0/0/0/0/1/1/4/0/87
MLETLKNYVTGCFRTREQSPHNFMQSDTKKKVGIEAVNLQGSRKFAHLKLILIYIFKHFGYDFRKISTVKKYLAEYEMKFLLTLGTN